MKQKKYWSILLVLIMTLGISLIFSSCSKDEDNYMSEEFLIGRWYECEENGDLKAPSREYIVFCIEFLPEGNLIEYAVDKEKLTYLSQFNWTLSSDKLTIKYNSNTAKPETFSITFKNGILIIGEDHYFKKQ